MKTNIIPAKGNIYRGYARKLFLPAGKVYYECVEAVIREINAGIPKERNASEIVIAAFARDGVVVLQAVRTRAVQMPTLTASGEIVPVWRRITSPPIDPDKVSADNSTETSAVKYFCCPLHLQQTLENESDEWYDQLGNEIPYAPDYLLMKYLSGKRTREAAILAYCLLGHLARKPTKNHRKIFRIFKNLSRHRDRDQFQAAILHGLKKLAHYTNELADLQNGRNGRISKALLGLHYFLSRDPRGYTVPGLATFPPEFVYVPGPALTAQLL